MDTVITIEKEHLANVKFVGYEVLKDLSARQERRTLIERAMIVGNNSKSKSKILFESEQGKLQVETTIWAATDDVVTLKGGLMIPVHCIEKVEFN